MEAAIASAPVGKQNQRQTHSAACEPNERIEKMSIERNVSASKSQSSIEIP